MDYIHNSHTTVLWRPRAGNNMVISQCVCLAYFAGQDACKTVSLFISSECVIVAY